MADTPEHVENGFADSPDEAAGPPGTPVQPQVVDGFGVPPGTATFRDDANFKAVDEALLAFAAERGLTGDEYRRLRSQVQRDTTSGALSNLITTFAGGDASAYALSLVEGLEEETSERARAETTRTQDRVERELEQSNTARARRIADSWDAAYSGIERRLRDIAEGITTSDLLTQAQAKVTLTNFLSNPVQEKLFDAFVDFVDEEERGERADPERFIFGGTPVTFRLETTASAAWLRQNIDEVLAAARPDLKPDTFDQVKIRGDMIQGLIPILAREGIRERAMGDLNTALWNPSIGILSGLLGDTFDARFSETQIAGFDAIAAAFPEGLVDRMLERFADLRLVAPDLSAKDFVAQEMGDIAVQALRNAGMHEQAAAITGQDIITALGTLRSFQTKAELQEEATRAAGVSFLANVRAGLPDDQLIAFDVAAPDLLDSLVASGSTDPEAFFRADPTASQFVQAGVAAGAEVGAEEERAIQQQDLGAPVSDSVAAEIAQLQTRIDSGEFSPEQTAQAQQRLNLLTRFGAAAASQFGAEAAAGSVQTREEFLAGAFPTPEFPLEPVGGPEAAAAREREGTAPLDFSPRDIFAADITTVDKNIEAQFLGAVRSLQLGGQTFAEAGKGGIPTLEEFAGRVQQRAFNEARRLNRPTDNISSTIQNAAIAQEVSNISGGGTVGRVGESETQFVVPPPTQPRRRATPPSRVRRAST